MSSASPFTISELGADAMPELTLTGRALPFQPFALSGTMRVEASWYPGNPTGSLQVLGGKEEPTTVAGKWSDRYITDAPRWVAALGPDPIVGAKALVGAMDNIRARGRLVEVQWDSFIRRGVLTKFTARWIRSEDVEWEAEFTWISRGTAQVFPTEQPALRLAARSVVKPDVIAQKSSLLDRIQELSEGTNARMQELRSLGNQYVDLADSIATGLLEPLAIARQALGLAQAAVNVPVDALVEITHQSTTAWERLYREGDKAFTGDFLQAGADRRKRDNPTAIGTTARMRTDARGLERAYREQQRAAAKQRTDIEKSLGRRRIIDIYVASEDADLRTLAVGYYGDMRDWQFLREFNGLAGPELHAGDVVLVPEMTEARA